MFHLHVHCLVCGAMYMGTLNRLVYSRSNTYYARTTIHSLSLYLELGAKTYLHSLWTVTLICIYGTALNYTSVANNIVTCVPIRLG